MQNKPRIVVTGMGAISPVGNTIDSLWKSLKTGVSGVGPMTSINAEGLATTYAAEVKDFKVEDYMEKKDVRKMDKFSQFAVAATQQAVTDSQLNLDSIDPFRVVTVHGVGIGGMQTHEQSLQLLFDKGPKYVPTMTIAKIISNSGPANSAMHYGRFCGPTYVVTTACSSGTDAIGSGVRHLFLDEADVVLVGGVEACITRFGVASFNVLHALSTKRADTPKEASRPFDANRDGFVMGEGGGVIIMETLEHAQKRGAKIYAEFVGYAGTCDAYHYTAPHPEGYGAIQAMKQSIARAGITPKDIDYVNAHGTSTPMNDSTETKAIKQVFGDDITQHPKVSSTKSMTGHCIGATGIFEAMACIFSVRDNFIPPTINLEQVDEQCQLNHVANVGINSTVRYAMSNTFGFGGHNGVVVFKKYSD